MISTTDVWCSHVNGKVKGKHVPQTLSNPWETSPRNQEWLWKDTSNTHSLISNSGSFFLICHRGKLLSGDLCAQKAIINPPSHRGLEDSRRNRKQALALSLLPNTGVIYLYLRINIQWRATMKRESRYSSEFMTLLTLYKYSKVEFWNQMEVSLQMFWEGDWQIQRFPRAIPVSGLRSEPWWCHESKLRL